MHLEINHRGQIWEILGRFHATQKLPSVTLLRGNKSLMANLGHFCNTWLPSSFLWSNSRILNGSNHNLDTLLLVTKMTKLNCCQTIVISFMHLWYIFVYNHSYIKTINNRCWLQQILKMIFGLLCHVYFTFWDTYVYHKCKVFFLSRWKMSCFCEIIPSNM